MQFLIVKQLTIEAETLEEALSKLKQATPVAVSVSEIRQQQPMPATNVSLDDSRNPG
jgi:hypothetical protein